jgi:hypothetical protein
VKYFYKSLLYKDLFIHFYLNSIFLKLKYSASSIKLNYISTNLVICIFDIYVNSIYRLKRYFKFFFLKIVYLYNTIGQYFNLLKLNKKYILKNKTFSKLKLLNLFYFLLKKKYIYIFSFTKYFIIEYIYNKINIVFNYNLHFKILLSKPSFKKIKYNYKQYNNNTFLKNINFNICFSSIVAFNAYKKFFYFIFFKKNKILNIIYLKFIFSINKNINYTIISYTKLLFLKKELNYIINIFFFKNISFLYNFYNKFSLLKNKNLFNKNTISYNNAIISLSSPTYYNTIFINFSFFFFNYKFLKYNNFLKKLYKVNIKKYHILYLIKQKKKTIINFFKKSLFINKSIFFY